MCMTSNKYCVLILAANSLLFLMALGAIRFTPESTPVARGAAYAQTRSCIGCHGDPGNPSADTTDVACSNVNKLEWHPQYRVNCDDVMAYFESVRLLSNIEERARTNGASPLIAGELLARRYHCFRCHGQLGQGGFENARSLKGYVPGYFGRDFMALTRNADPDSIRQWITQGVDNTIVENAVTGPIANFFFNRQSVSMPSFESLESEEIDILVHYVTILHQYGPMTANSVRAYSQQSQINE